MKEEGRILIETWVDSSKGDQLNATTFFPLCFYLKEKTRRQFDDGSRSLETVYQSGFVQSKPTLVI